MRTRTRTRIALAGLLVLGLVAPCWSLALTTFGKSNTQSNNQNDNKPSGEHVKARECMSDSECAGIKGASCLESIFARDQKLRCLCGNYKEPNNGLCSNQYNHVQVRCSRDEECTPNAQCVVGNMTNLMGTRCWCKQGFAVDADMECGGSPAALSLSALSLIASLLLAGSV